MAISSNARQILRKMQARKVAVRQNLTRVAPKLKNMLVAESRKILSDKVYGVAIPTVTRHKQAAGVEAYSLETRRRIGHTFEKRKKPKKEKLWKRTGQLLARETGFTRGPVIYLTNPMAYAGARYKLGTADGRQIRTPGVKSVQWHAEALVNRKKEILELRRRAVLEALQSP